MKGRKLVIIIPPSPWLISDTDLPPLGPLYVSSYLKAEGHDVTVCDLSGLGQKDWKIPVGDIYAIGGTSPNFQQIRDIVNILKNREADSMVLVGGVHATLLPLHVLLNTRADGCIIGEGELVLAEIARIGLSENVRGIVFWKDGNITETGKRDAIPCLDSFPFPDYEAIDFYKYMESKTFKYLGATKEAVVMSARGCPYNCSFCASPSIWKRKVRYRDPEAVAGEVSYLKRKYGIDLVYFVDDTFVVNKKRVSELCESLSWTGVNWHCLNRVDRCESELLRRMRNTGCLGVVYGFESGDDAMLRRMRKNTTVSQALEAARITKKVGMKVRGQIIVGFPGETDESVEKTAEFMRKAEEVDVFGVHVFQPFPGSDVWEYPDKYGAKVDKNTDFSMFKTIGRPDDVLTKDEQVMDWFHYLRSVAGSRNIELHGASND